MIKERTISLKIPHKMADGICPQKSCEGCALFPLSSCSDFLWLIYHPSKIKVIK